MPNVLLGVTGSVAAIYTRELFDDLRRAGHQVKVVATRPALFFDPATVGPREPGVRNRDVLILDEDEWAGERYRRGDPVLHIELRRWADALLIAPLDANTLAKFALGLCDNCLTCVYRAWDRSRPAVLAPAMNTLMWEHPATVRHLVQIAADWTGALPPDGRAENVNAWLQKRGSKLTFLNPMIKQLACSDLGIGAMADRADIVVAMSGVPCHAAELGRT